MAIGHLWGLAGILTARQFVLIWGFLGLFRPGFPVAGVIGAHCPQGQLVRRGWSSSQVSQSQQQGQPFLVLGQAPVAYLSIAEYLLHVQEGVFHLGPYRRLDLLSPRAAGLSGSSFRRWPSFMATCQSIGNPRFSCRFCTPM